MPDYSRSAVLEFVLMAKASYRTAKWSFLTNHARALICIADDPGVRLREIASALGITERTVRRWLA